MISATIISDSISPEQHRLTTFKLRYPKFIHGELMTHRVFSRNASSSRAVPTAKLLEEVCSDALRATFVWWGKNEPGMQANAELEGKPLQEVKEIWESAACSAACFAEEMLKRGAHKQLVNRLLEPFSHINVVVSATEYMNFFGLRLDAGAQPEMRALAQLMWKEYQESRPQMLMPGQWHLPFVPAMDSVGPMVGRPITWQAGLDDIDTMIKVSVARCARVSYESFETGKKSTIEEDVKLYDRLMGSQPVHASPAEHQATPDTFSDCRWSWHDLSRQPTANEIATKDGWVREPLWYNADQHGNFVGWRQHRKMVAGESLAPLPSYVETV